MKHPEARKASVDCQLRPVVKAPTILEGNNKSELSDTTAGLSATFKNWASELQIYMWLEAHNLIDILENVMRQTTPIYDDEFIDH
eukprot:3377096-Amphidinium_carterae.1